MTTYRTGYDYPSNIMYPYTIYVFARFDNRRITPRYAIDAAINMDVEGLLNLSVDQWNTGSAGTKL